MSAPIITATQTVYRFKTLPLPSYAANQAVTWTASDGTITAGGVYSPPNRSGSYIVTAINGANEVSNTTLTVNATFPFEPNWQYKRKKKEPVLLSVAEDERTVVVRYKGLPVKSWVLGFKGRTQTEENSFDSFRDYHRLDKQFYYEDKEKALLLLVRFDMMEYEVEQGSYDSADFSCVLTEF